MNINTDSSTTALTYASQDGGPPVITFTGPIEVPEPASVPLLAGGFLALAIDRTRAMT